MTSAVTDGPARRARSPQEEADHLIGLYDADAAKITGWSLALLIVGLGLYIGSVSMLLVGNVPH